MKALVTGASKGIGRAIAESLAQNQYNLILNARNRDELSALGDSLRRNYPKIHCDCIAADLTSEKLRDDFIDAIKSKHQKLDILVNNAGVFEPGDLFEYPEKLEYAMELHLRAPYYLTKGVYSLLKNSSSPHVVNIGSVMSVKPNAESAAYSISKYALRGLSANLREVFKSDGIKVTNVMPGHTWSNSWSGAKIPRERLMEPEDVARVVLCAVQLGPSAVMEEVTLRPMQGDLPD